MSKVRTLVVEDEQQNIDLLLHFVKTYCPNLDVVGCAKNSEDAEYLIATAKPDLLFLDIMLGESNSFDLLDLLAEKQLNVIFITAYNQFALKAFQYSAIDYLLKPLEIDALVDAVNKATKKIEMQQDATNYAILKTQLTNEQRDDEQLTIPMLDSIEVVKLSAIRYVVADGKYSTFMLDGERKIVSSKNIGHYETILPQHLFYRVHHAYIVGLNHISKIDKKAGNVCVMSDGCEIPISRRKKVGFLEALGS
jgi:two-component system LytT family response regulator